MTLNFSLIILIKMVKMMMMKMMLTFSLMMLRARIQSPSCLVTVPDGPYLWKVHFVTWSFILMMMIIIIIISLSDIDDDRHHRFGVIIISIHQQSSSTIIKVAKLSSKTMFLVAWDFFGTWVFKFFNLYITFFIKIGKIRDRH